MLSKIGITYKIGVPQAISDSWMLFYCDNVPEDLPKGISVVECSISDYIGCGVDDETAKKMIEKYGY